MPYKQGNKEGVGGLGKAPVPWSPAGSCLVSQPPQESPWGGRDFMSIAGTSDVATSKRRTKIVRNQLFFFPFFTNQFFSTCFFSIKVDEGRMLYSFHFAFFPLNEWELVVPSGWKRTGRGDVQAGTSHTWVTWMGQLVLGDAVSGCLSPRAEEKADADRGQGSGLGAPDGESRWPSPASDPGLWLPLRVPSPAAGCRVLSFG